jgi:hypothetical protein
MDPQSDNKSNFCLQNGSTFSQWTVDCTKGGIQTTCRMQHLCPSHSFETGVVWPPFSKIVQLLNLSHCFHNAMPILILIFQTISGSLDLHILCFETNVSQFLRSSVGPLWIVTTYKSLFQIWSNSNTGSRTLKIVNYIVYLNMELFCCLSIFAFFNKVAKYFTEYSLAIFDMRDKCFFQQKSSRFLSSPVAKECDSGF